MAMLPRRGVIEGHFTWFGRWVELPASYWYTTPIYAWHTTATLNAQARTIFVSHRVV